MKDELISFETAKLAKELGFFKPKAGFVDWWYTSDGKHIYEHYDGRMSNIPAPTQSLLQRWLRETHNLNPTPKEIHIGEITLVKKYIDGFGQDNMEYDTYEECLEVGLMKCLIHIKKLHHER